MAVCKEFADYAANAWLEAADIVRDMCNIPAPSHHEELRAEYCRNWFEKNGFADVTIDKALNVVVPLN
ncbi:MAG: peptidase, partial [Lentisphaeria bacterium]|nr:peptidase [Lentisphaeria bacterium]